MDHRFVTNSEAAKRPCHARDFAVCFVVSRKLLMDSYLEESFMSIITGGLGLLYRRSYIDEYHENSGSKGFAVILVAGPKGPLAVIRSGSL